MINVGQSQGSVQGLLSGKRDMVAGTCALLCPTLHHPLDVAHQAPLELAGCGPGHPQLEAGGGQPEPERGTLSPREGISYQTAKRLPVSNQDFLRFLEVNIHREGRSQRSAPQKRHTTHQRRACPRNQAARTWEVIRCTTP